jgi:hypothetical protein
MMDLYALLTRWCLQCFLPAFGLLVLTGTAQAQAREGSTRVSEFSAFGELQYLQTGSPGYHDGGIIAGADYSYLRHGLIIPAFEVRGTFAPSGGNIGERSLLVGGRLSLRLGGSDRIQPFADLLIGAGVITYGNPSLSNDGTYSSDNSVVVNYGGGVEYTVADHFGLLADVQRQHWNTGDKSDPHVFEPYSINVGVRYHIPFRAHTR